MSEKMTAEEAANILGPHYDGTHTISDLDTARWLGYCVLRLQIPRSPFPDGDKSILACPNCGSGEYLHNQDEAEKELKSYIGGSLIRQYMNQKDLEKTPVDIQVQTAADPDKIREFVDTHCDGVLTQPQDASIRRENGAFVITESVLGKVVDADATASALNTAFEGMKDAGDAISVKAVITEKQPAITSDDLKTISDVLGTCTTDFSSSGAARSTNLAVGAGKINGRVLMPGEVISGYECLQPFTLENGYKTAAAYENGQVVDSIGGGVCQIATTLYDAALQAEMEIVQRQNHSMIVTYVKPSMDAAIAGTYKDIKIKNNYSTPVYIEGYTSGKKLTFTLYGKETRPSDRQVEYVSETVGTTDPGEPQLITDNSLAPGARVKVQSAHTGYKSRLWKVVTVGGVEQERTLLNEDTYNASKAIYRVGPAQAAPAPVPEQTAPVTTPETTEIIHLKLHHQSRPRQKPRMRQLQEKTADREWFPLLQLNPRGIMLVRKARPVPHRRRIHENSRTGSGRI